MLLQHPIKLPREIHHRDRKKKKVKSRDFPGQRSNCDFEFDSEFNRNIIVK